MPAKSRRPHADRVAAMSVEHSASSSRSWHERDDRAERIILMRGGMWMRVVLVEQLAVARQLAAERGVLAKVPALRRHVSASAAGYALLTAFR